MTCFEGVYIAFWALKPIKSEVVTMLAVHTFIFHALFYGKTCTFHPIFDGHSVAIWALCWIEKLAISMTLFVYDIFTFFNSIAFSVNNLVVIPFWTLYFLRHTVFLIIFSLFCGAGCRGTSLYCDCYFCLLGRTVVNVHDDFVPTFPIINSIHQY